MKPEEAVPNAVGPATASLDVLLLRAGASVIAVDLQFVERVLQLAELQPVPGGAVWVAGLLTLRGRTWPVFDLALLCGHADDTRYTPDTPILLLAEGERRLGLVVEEVLGVRKLPVLAEQLRDEFADDPLFGAALAGAFGEALLLKTASLLARSGGLLHAEPASAVAERA